MQAGNLALEARRATKDDVSIVVYPEALARALGTSVKSAVERVLTEIDTRSASNGKPLGGEGRAQLADILGMANDLETAEFALNLDVTKGVAILARLRAKAGTKLAELSSNVLTVPVDPLLFGKNDAGLVVTTAYPERTLNQFRRLRALLAAKESEKPGAKDAVKINKKDLAAAGHFVDTVAEALTGTASMVGRLHPTLSMELSYPIKDAAAAKKLQAALLAVDRNAVLAMLAVQGAQGGVDVKVPAVRKETVGKVSAVHWNLVFTLPGDKQGTLKKLLGAPGIDMYGAIVGDRMIVTMGTGAKARLAAMAAQPKETAPKGALAEATKLAGARSLYYYADLREALGLAANIGGPKPDPRLRMLSAALTAPIPILGGVSGDAQGRVLTLDLTFPPSCLAGIGGVMGAVLGAGMTPAK
jgi:hypothetical protein